METFQLWISLHTVLVILFLSFTPEGSGCDSPSSPLCFRRTSDDSVYICEWTLTRNESEVTFDLHFDFNTTTLTIPNIKTTWCEVREEQLITGRTVTNWVVAHFGDSSCSSPRQAVLLGKTVKFDAPRNISASWLKNNLTLKWQAAEEFPALAEIWCRRDEPTNNSWEKTLINTAHEGLKYRATVVNLLKNVSYRVQIRHQSTHVGNPLWSHWSPLAIIPAELDHKPNVSIKSQLVNGMRRVVLSWKAMPYAASVKGIHYVVNDSQSSQGCPCKKKQHITIGTKYTFYVSHAPINISIVAENEVGFSPPATLHLPAAPLRGLKMCKKTLLNETLSQKTCLECFELQEEDSSPRNGMRMSQRKMKKERAQTTKSIQDYVRYLYFEHKCENGKPQTVEMCLFYQKEGAPNMEPQDFVAVNETESSVNLTWTAVPVKHQRGFLTHYRLCSQRSSSPEEGKDCFNISTSEIHFHLNNLMPGTKYSLSLSAATRVGNGPEATVMINTKPEKPVNVWLSFGLLLLFFLFSTMCTIVLKRIKKKMFPTVPKPVIPDLSSYQAANQEFLERKEEVHKLVLLPLRLEGESTNEEAEVTVLRGRWEEGSDEEYERTDSEEPDEESSSPDGRETTLRLSEELDLEQMDTALANLIYKNGLVFDVKTDST